MLLTTELKIKINSTAIKHYIDCGYAAKIGREITVKTFDLSESSTYKVSVKCDICGVEKDLIYNKYLKNIKKYNIYACSNKCAIIKNKKTCLEKYEVEFYNNTNKSKKTCLEKYGVENVFQLEEIKNKIKKTCLEKYGVESTNSLDYIIELKKQSNLEKYGVDHFSKTEEFKNIMIKYNENAEYKINKKMTYEKTCLNKYGVTHTSSIPEIKNKIKISNQNTYLLKKDKKIINVNFDKKIYTCKCDICEKEYLINYNVYKSRKRLNTILCTTCNPITSHISGLEIQLYNFIKSNYNKTILVNKKIIAPYEIDIYLPDLKMAFEFNGIWWHNEINKDINYHLNKTEMCENKGIQLMHIYEDDWLHKQEILKSIILNKLGKTENIILNTEIREIYDDKIVEYFLEENHIEGNIKSKIKIGLFYENELVSLMIFNKKYNIFNLLRFCDKKNINVVGGYDKMLKYFVIKYNPIKLLAIMNRNFNNEKLYIDLGFKLENKTKPNREVRLLQKTSTKNIIHDSGNLIFRYV